MRRNWLAQAGFSRLTVEYQGGSPDVSALDGSLVLLLYIDDMAVPRARVKLTDLIKQGGVRPLNLRFQPGQIVRITLEDPNAAWQQGAPDLSVVLE